MKIFCFYLPQFHEIPENNMWWGQGFTEWTNVKKAKQIIKGQYQPKVPLNDNYYNLMDIKTVEWQTDLLDKYNVDGMIYYHYYFEGKKLLEKPAENLLSHTEINQPFFFCWANHSWIRSWNGTKEILMEQTYGDEKSWEEHFQYLLPFFKDDRYEKKDNKPLFMIFKSGFDDKSKMMDYFDKRCVDYGFNGIYLFETCPDKNDVEYSNFTKQLSPYSHVFYREPGLGLRNEYKKNMHRYYARIRAKFSDKGFGTYIWHYRGDDCLKYTMSYESEFSDATPGLFFEWDNTSRHGKRGYIITPVSHDVFTEYMNHYKDSEYMFVNAWNEWCEGMMLEPTEKDGYKYLEWIKEWKENNER